MSHRYSCGPPEFPSIRDRRPFRLLGDTYAFFAWLYASCPASTASCTWSCAKVTIFCALRFKSLPVPRTWLTPALTPVAISARSSSPALGARSKAVTAPTLTPKINVKIVPGTLPFDIVHLLFRKDLALVSVLHACCSACHEMQHK